MPTTAAVADRLRRQLGEARDDRFRVALNTAERIGGRDPRGRAGGNDDAAPHGAGRERGDPDPSPTPLAAGHRPARRRRMLIVESVIDQNSATAQMPAGVRGGGMMLSRPGGEPELTRIVRSSVTNNVIGSGQFQQGGGIYVSWATGDGELDRLEQRLLRCRRPRRRHPGRARELRRRAQRQARLHHRRRQLGGQRGRPALGPDQGEPAGVAALASGWRYLLPLGRRSGQFARLQRLRGAGRRLRDRPPRRRHWQPPAVTAVRRTGVPRWGTSAARSR